MKQYLNLLSDVMEHGSDKGNRTGVWTRSVFGRQLRFDLQEGFPLLTTKKVHLKSIIYELLWFLKGDTNINYLKDHSVSIWDEWADDNGDLGPVYGSQWRNFGGHFMQKNGLPPKGVDQVRELVDKLKNTPNDRRMIVSAWNPLDVSEMALPPCHMFYQCYVANGELSLLMYQRSCDLFLGVPFNIASYALLTMMLAQVCGLKAKEFIHSMGDTHLYNNHFEQVNLQLSREPRPLPKMVINPAVKNIDDFQFEDFKLEGYDPWPAIKADVAV